MKVVWPRMGLRWAVRTVEPSVPSLHVSLADPVIEHTRWLQWVMVSAIVLSGALTLWGWWESMHVREVAEQYERAAARVLDGTQQFTAQLAREGLMATPQDLAVMKRKVAFAKELATKQEFSWSTLLVDLESVVPPRTSINTVALNFLDSRVSLRGEAQTLKDFNVLVSGFQRHPAFRDVLVSDHVLQHQAELTDDGRIAFHLTVQYLGMKSRPKTT